MASSSPVPLELQGVGDSEHMRLSLAPRDRPYVLRVGRAPDNDVVLRNRSVSGRHAHIEVGGPRDYRITIRDFGVDGSGSRFGTFVGEAHLKGSAADAQRGETIRFGTVKYGAQFLLQHQAEAAGSSTSRAHGFLRDQQGFRSGPAGRGDKVSGSFDAHAGRAPGGLPPRGSSRGGAGPPHFIGPGGQPITVNVRGDGLLGGAGGAAALASDPDLAQELMRSERQVVLPDGGAVQASLRRGASLEALDRPPPEDGRHRSQVDKPYSATSPHRPETPSDEARGRKPGGKPSPRVTLAYPTASGYVERDSRDPASWAGAWQDAPSNAQRAYDHPAREQPEHSRPSSRQRADVHRDSGPGTLTNDQWEQLQGERDAALAHIKDVELALTGVAAFEDVALVHTEPGGGLRPEGGHRPVGELEQELAARSRQVRELLALADVRHAQDREEEIEKSRHELERLRRQVQAHQMRRGREQGEGSTHGILVPGDTYRGLGKKGQHCGALLLGTSLRAVVQRLVSRAFRRWYGSAVALSQLPAEKEARGGTVRLSTPQNSTMLDATGTLRKDLQVKALAQLASLSMRRKFRQWRSAARESVSQELILARRSRDDALRKADEVLASASPALSDGSSFPSVPESFQDPTMSASKRAVALGKERALHGEVEMLLEAALARERSLRGDAERERAEAVSREKTLRRRQVEWHSRFEDLEKSHAEEKATLRHQVAELKQELEQAGGGFSFGPGSPVKTLSDFQARAINSERQMQTEQVNIRARLVSMIVMMCRSRFLGQALFKWRSSTIRIHRLHCLTLLMKSLARSYLAMQTRNAFKLWRRKMNPDFLVDQGINDLLQGGDRDKAYTKKEVEALVARVQQLEDSVRQAEDDVAIVQQAQTSDWPSLLMHLRRHAGSLRRLLVEERRLRERGEELAAVLLAQSGLPFTTLAQAEVQLLSSGETPTPLEAAGGDFLPRPHPATRLTHAVRPPEASSSLVWDQNRSPHGKTAHTSHTGATLPQPVHGQVEGHPEGLGDRRPPLPGSSAAQQYLAAKARETLRAWRETEELRRRLDCSKHAWATAKDQHRVLKQRLVQERMASQRHAQQLLHMVSERDARLVFLQKELVELARAEVTDQEMEAGEGGHHKFRAIEVLQEHMLQMQREDVARATALLEVMHTLEIPNGTPKEEITGGLSGDMAHLRGQVVELQDQITEMEQQGSVQAVVEALELIDYLQGQVSGLEHRVVTMQGQHLRVFGTTTLEAPKGGTSTSQAAQRKTLGSRTSGNQQHPTSTSAGFVGV